MGENGSVSRYCHRRYRRQYRLRYRRLRYPRRCHHGVRKGRVISAALRGTVTSNRVTITVTIVNTAAVTTATTAAITTTVATLVYVVVMKWEFVTDGT